MNEFFNTADGMTKTGTVSTTNQQIVGYFDILSSDVFVDDAAAGTRAELVCQASEVSKSIVGKSLTIDSTVYRINGYQPDGSGLVTLTLLDEDY